MKNEDFRQIKTTSNKMIKKLTNTYKVNTI